MNKGWMVAIFDKGRLDKVVGPFTYDEASDWIMNKINSSLSSNPNIEYSIVESEKP